MFRLFAALLCGLLAAPLFAEDPPKKPAEPVKPVPVSANVSVTFRTLNVKDGMVATTAVVPVVENVPVTTTEFVNGKTVTVTRMVATTKLVVKETTTKLADLKATGTDGKAIPGDALEKAYKDGGVVVVHAGKLDDKFRKLFKDGTAFVEETPPAPPPPVAPPK